MKVNKLLIKETTKDDLRNIMSLWNDGEVMQFVGFPEGLGISYKEMERWLEWSINKPRRCHYSIYHDELGYCGETFYNVNEHGMAALDIKLLALARARGLACQALSFAIEQAFKEGQADLVYVDPHPDNERAWRLYERMGFLSKARPQKLGDGESYLEITREQWYK